MQFKVTNVIPSFNSASGGPPRTVAAISRAGREHWVAELYTTSHLEGSNDRLLLREFFGHVNLLPASAHSVVGGCWQSLTGSFQAQLLQGIQPDVIHIHGLWHPLLAAFAWTARRHGIPYIVASHGMLDPWCLKIKPLRKSLALRSYQGAILSAATAIHTCSDKEAENLRCLPYVRCPVYVVPNPIDPPDEARAQASVETKRDQKVLLYLSRLHSQKGLDLLLQAWSELRPSGWELAIAGGGSAHYVNNLKRLCAREGLSNVRFYGQVEGELREAMFTSAVAFVLPTYSENFGNAIAEALMRGLPVLTTTGTPWSVLPRLGCGWYVEPKPETLKRALGELLAMDVPSLRAMGARAREYARVHLSLDTVRSSLLQMYLTTMPRRREGAFDMSAG